MNANKAEELAGSVETPERPYGESLRLGRQSLQRGGLGTALAHFEAALTAKPEDLSARLDLARTFQALRRPAEAEEVYVRILEQHPNNLPAHYRLGLILMQRRDLTGALTHLEAAGAQNAENIQIQLKIANVLGKLDRHAESEQLYRGVLERDPGNTDAERGVGEAEWAQGRRSEALDHLQDVLVKRPDDVKANLNLANRLLAQNRLDDAESAYGRVVAVEPNNVDGLFGLGRCAMLRGDQNGAASLFQAALAIEPNNRRIQFQLMRLDENIAAQDWRSELRGAAAVLRTADSSPQERVWAAKLLVEYGVTDLIQEVFGGGERVSPELRHYLLAAQQLDRLGLSQPAGSLDAGLDPEQDELNVLTGVVERLNPGAETLVLVFSGRLHRTFLSLDVMHRILRTTGVSLVYLRDIERTRYLGGVVGLGQGFGGAESAFRDILARSGARRLLTIGHCVGCAGAMNYGLALGAEAVLGVAPRIAFPKPEELAPQAAAKVAALQEANPRYTRDMWEVYANATKTPSVTLIAGADVEPDASVAREISSKVAGVKFVAMPGAYSECFKDILARGLLSPLLSSFVKDGAVAPDILDTLSQAAPNDAGAGAASIPTRTA